jgi:hypothetical protein
VSTWAVVERVSTGHHSLGVAQRAALGLDDKSTASRVVLVTREAAAAVRILRCAFNSTSRFYSLCSFLHHHKRSAELC